MTLPPKLEKLLENWPAKILAFIVALFLYAYNQIASLDTKNIGVSLDVIADGITVPAETVQTSVRLTLRTEAVPLRELSSKDFSAYVDISRITESGTYTLPVKLRLSEEAVAVDPLEIQIQPEYLTIKVERYETAVVPVTLVVSGDVAEGYEINGISQNLSTVTISGPESIVSAVKDVKTEPLFFVGKTESFSSEVGLVSPGNFVTFDDSLRIGVSVDVQPKVIEKVYENVPISMFNVEDSVTTSISSSYATLTVRGEQPFLDTFAVGRGIVYVDCKGFFENAAISRPVKMVTKIGAQFVSVEPEYVLLTVVEKEKPKPVEKEPVLIQSPLVTESSETEVSE